MKSSHVHFIQNLDDVPNQNHTIPIVDKNLPNQITRHFENALTVNAGESIKTLTAIESLAENILERRAEKPLTLIAVGGGALGDAVGFLASILWRGVGLIHIPTTILSMVDSAHGGKTAVNLGAMKNQLGSFYPADDVYIVTEIIETMPAHLRLEGLAEVVKTGWLDGEAFVHELDGVDWDHPDQMIEMIQNAVAFKTSIVEQDPFDDQDIRIQLNLGHTCAHGIERTAKISHGESVAWGLLATAQISPELDQNNRDRLFTQAVKMIRPNAAVRSVSKDMFAQAVNRDKKRKDDQLRTLTLSKPGSWNIQTDLSSDDWYDALRSSVARVDGSVELSFSKRKTTIRLPESKSERIRAICLGAVDSVDPCDDVWFAERAFKQLQSDVIQIGEGATPFRFLAVRAAFTKTAQTTFELGESLNRRDHGELTRALAENGIRSEHNRERGTFTIFAGERPVRASLQAQDHRTSQVASAFLLLIRVGIVVDFDVTNIASKPYFQMTQSMVADATIRIDSDASAFAFWVLAQDLGADVEVVNPPQYGRQPDAQIHEILRKAKEETSVSLRNAPDLGPVLAGWAAASGNPLTVIEASHLRNKESDRIVDLARSLRSVGVEIEVRDDGFDIGGRGLQSGEFKTYEDHRLAMCAALLSTKEKITIDNAGCVSKSYPRFWQDARRAGWRVKY